MQLDPREVMDLAISTMSAMTFSWGFVHCDPHPGNLLVRKHPTKKGKPQLVGGSYFNQANNRSLSTMDCISLCPRSSVKSTAHFGGLCSFWTCLPLSI